MKLTLLSLIISSVAISINAGEIKTVLESKEVIITGKTAAEIVKNLDVKNSNAISCTRTLETTYDLNGQPIHAPVHTCTIEDLSQQTLYYLERTFWWLHIIGILIFLNYLYYSKHLHIILAFPNTFYGSISNSGKLNNMKSVTNEVNIMMGKAIEPEINEDIKFGVSDVTDLSWLQILNAYSCTECGRCTSVCPANITGKKLSPRKIMMETRDRVEEFGKNIDKNGSYIEDNKKLLGDYISKEELWACTSCNACVEECPISIDPLSIIMDMRRNLIMEESSAPVELNNMMNNIENNGAPWPYNQQDRLNWNE